MGVYLHICGKVTNFFTSSSISGITSITQYSQRLYYLYLWFDTQEANYNSLFMGYSLKSVTIDFKLQLITLETVLI